MSHAPYAALCSTQTRYVSPDTSIDEHEVRSFYLDVLGGIEVRPPDGVRPDNARYFLIEQQLIEVRATRDHDHLALELTVDSPLNVAERCWNAGYSVRLEGDDHDAILHVADPCGQLIAVLPRKDNASAADIQG